MVHFRFGRGSSAMPTYPAIPDSGRATAVWGSTFRSCLRKWDKPVELATPLQQCNSAIKQSFTPVGAWVASCCRTKQADNQLA